jgi:DNA-binding phage protein
VHISERTPINGTLQAEYGSGGKLGYWPVPRHDRPAYLAALQSALADNVRVLMDRKWPQLRSKDDRISELAKLTGIGRNTIYRILDPEGTAKNGAYVYPRLDTIATLARRLEVSAADLLTPDFALRNQVTEAGKRKPAA